MENGWPLPKRKKFLAGVSGAPAEHTHPVRFQGKTQHFAIRRIPLDLPLYRLENGRTTDRQAEYLVEHPKLDENFFRSDLESREAQVAQHSLLAKLAGDRKKNLFKEFETEEQKEPIILSQLGIVVNGNRRLATWRDLYESDPKRFERFKNIDAVILPFCDERDLDALEANLQLQEDLKAEYSWTARALMFKEKRDLHRYSEEEISSLYDISIKDLRELFDSLDYADSYLESREKPRKYSDVDNKNYAFVQISRTRKRLKSSPAHKDAFERAAFCLADESGEGERTYTEIKRAGDTLDQIVENLVNELDLDTNGGSETETLIAVSDALAQPENFEDARLVIRDTIEADTARKRHKKKVDFVADQIQKARENLSAAQGAIDDRSSRKGCAENLSEISKLVAGLQSWVTSDGE